MKQQSKPLASLSPVLLARKGGARPVPRSGLASAHGDCLSALDFGLGDFWDDQDSHADVVPISRAADANEVRLQQQRLAGAYSPVPARQSRPRRAAFDRGCKAAFTLRLDEERHLRLRLACTASNRSAQQMVTDALDRLLAEMPELEAIAGELSRKRKA